MNIEELFNNYLDSIQGKCSDSTVDTYKNRYSTAKKFLLSEADTITNGEAQELIDRLNEQYATKTVHGIYDVINAVYKKGVKEGYINKNPFESVKVSDVQRHVPIILSVEQTEALLKACEDNISLYLPVLIAIETGLRRSQVLALLWGDIDFKNSKMSVSRNLISAKKHLFTPGKEHQKRTIAMTPRLSGTLLGVKNQRRDNGINVGDDEPVCLTSSSTFMEPTYFDKLFRKLVVGCEAVSDKLRFHDLRWTFINEQVRQGTDPMSIADLVGHKSCVFTMDYYYRFHHKAA